MLVKTDNDMLAHIRKPGCEETWCGQKINMYRSAGSGELCDQCLDAIIAAERVKNRSRRVKCRAG